MALLCLLFVEGRAGGIKFAKIPKHAELTQTK